MGNDAIIRSDAEAAHWCDTHGASIEVSRGVGTWIVVVHWCRLVSMSDVHGTRKETWSITRQGKSLSTVLRVVVDAAREVSSRGAAP